MRFVLSSSLSIYFSITWVKKIVCHTKDFVIYIEDRYVEVPL